MDEITAWVDGLLDRTPAVDIDKDTSLEAVLKGQAIELWSDRAGRLFLVADGEDVNLVMARCAARRGEIYSAAEARRIISINSPTDVAAIHRWKRKFNATIRDVEGGA